MYTFWLNVQNFLNSLFVYEIIYYGFMFRAPITRLHTTILK